MSPLRGIVTAARTLGFHLRMQEVTANNLANIGTAGFKADRLSARRLDSMESPVPYQATDWSQGALRVTGRPLDLALEGEGFFVVSTPAGERLVRGGSFRLDGEGRLVDSGGAPLLGRNGALALQGPEIEIRPDGTVLDGGTEVDRLRVALPAEGAGLLKESAGRLRPGDGSVRETPEATVVRQGQLEEANFNAVATMVQLVEVQRAYSANVTAVRTLDGVLQSITSDVGRVG